MRFKPSFRTSLPLALVACLGSVSRPVTAACPAIAAGKAHSLALASDGTVWSWGENSYGQLGDGSSCPLAPCVELVPRQVRDATGTGLLSNVVAVAAGDCHSVALIADGTVWTWGCNGYGELGDGSTRWQSSLPRQVRDATGSGFLAGIIAIAAGGWHSVALRSNGTVWAWGSNEWGQLGDGRTVGQSNLPVQVRDASGVGFLTGVVRLATSRQGGSSEGAGHTLALVSDGSLWAWGDNLKGQLGDGTTCPTFPCGSHLPVHVRDAAGTGILGVVVELAAGGGHSLAVTDDGRVWAWGNNSWWALGDGTSSDSSLPVQVRESPGTGYLAGIVGLSGTGLGSFALRGDGSLWAWGYNFHGQLGDGTDFDRILPVRVQVLTDVVGVAGSVEHSLALLPDGSIWAMGWNERGQLGTGTTQDEYLPTRNLVALGPGVPADQGNVLRGVRQGRDVVLSWNAASATSWQVFRDPAADRLGASPLGPPLGARSFTDAARLDVPGLDFYRLKGANACGIGP